MTKRHLSNRANSQLLTPWMFFVLGLIWIAITIGVFTFFSSTADVRIKEAKAMSDKIIAGISENGYLNEEVIGSNYDILGDSLISRKMMDNSGFFYFNLSIYDNNELKNSFTYGNSDFEIQCRLNGKQLAKCYEREFYLIDKSSFKILKIKLLTGSNNHGG
jgi:hypothetical protein